MSIQASRLKPETTGVTSPSNHVYRKLLILFFAAAMALPNMGCASGLRLGSLGFGDALLESYRDRVWAKRAYNLRYNNCDRPYETHFQNGFISGYCDTCNGGDGYVPALPPEDYRGFEYQSPDGAQCVKSWFEGFPAGVAAAKKDRAGEFHDIYTSRMINSAISQGNAKHILPNDVPVRATNSLGVVQTQNTTDAPPVPLDNGIVGTQHATSSQSAPYAAPPSTSENPLLNPRSLTPGDLVEAPTIRKSGPSSMAPISKMQQFTIDPSVKTEPSTTAPAVSAIAAVAQAPSSLPKALPSTDLKIAKPSTVPPIITTARLQTVPPIVETATVPISTVTRSQAPLPIAVRSAGNGWRSQTSRRRR